MATTAKEIFHLAMHLMDAGNESTGETDTNDNREYKLRTLAILNVLRTEAAPYSAGWQPDPAGGRALSPELTDLSQPVGLDDGLAQGVLPYGLAAHLLLTEDPDSAAFFHSRYQQLLRAAASGGQGSQETGDVYGGVYQNEHGEDGRWGH